MYGKRFLKLVRAISVLSECLHFNLMIISILTRCGDTSKLDPCNPSPVKAFTDTHCAEAMTIKGAEILSTTT